MQSALLAKLSLVACVLVAHVALASGPEALSAAERQVLSWLRQPRTPSAQDLYVDNVKGSDANRGDRSHPFKTIKQAMAKLPRGGCLHLVDNPGRPYLEGVRIRAEHAGTPTRPTVIDGHGALLDGLRVPPAAEWRDEGNGVYSRFLDNNAWPMDKDGCWCGAFPICYFGAAPGVNVKSRAELTERGRYFLQRLKPGQKLHNTLYVKLGPGESPEAARLGVLSGWENCCFSTTSNVVVRNLRVTRQSWDCFSTNTSKDCLIENCDGSYAMDQGISSHSSDGFYIVNSRFHHNTGCGVCDVNIPKHTYCRTIYLNCTIDANIYRNPLEFYGNIPTAQGLVPASADYTLINCKIFHNDLTRLPGEAIHHDAGARVRLIDCQIEGTVNGVKP